MAKYRNLQTDELKALEEDFIKFLAVQGVAATDWKKWQEDDLAKRDTYLSLFSDFVFETLISKTSFLYLKTSNQHRYIKVLDDRFEMIVFSKEESQEKSDFQISDVISPDIQIQKGEKLITTDKNMAVFALFEQGFLPVKKEEETTIVLLFEQISGNNH
ncbi:MAG: hypothetical protein IPN79_02310 [Saprospiraceae bacterium]|nr:hypothetical protein [Saprospiraceae bacterium]